MKNASDSLSDLTMKCFDVTVGHISSLWIKALKNKGIPLEDLNTIRADVYEESKDAVNLANNKCLSIVKNYSNKIIESNRRTDHFGRAVINYGFSQYLPKTLEEKEKILSEFIPGKLPHPVVISMITCIKFALGSDRLISIEEELTQIKGKYINSNSSAMDWDKFLTDHRVTDIVESSFMQLRKLFAGRDDARRREWVENILLNSRAFEKINRNLSDEEYQIIIKTLFE